MLKGLSCIDIVHLYYKLEYVSVCKDLKVDIFVIREDWGSKPHNIDVERYLKSKGKEIIHVRYSPRASYARIKQNIIAQSHNRMYTEQAMA